MAVAVGGGSGVILGKAVVVTDGAAVGLNCVTVGAALGTIAGFGWVGCFAAVGDADTEVDAGCATRQADATSTTITAIKSEVRALFMVQPGEQEVNKTWLSEKLSYNRHDKGQRANTIPA